MRLEDGTNRSQAMIHSSDPEIDSSLLSLAGLSLKGDRSESTNSVGHVSRYATDPRSEPLSSYTPLDRWLSEDNRLERLLLGLTLSEDLSSFDTSRLGLIEDSSSFDCKYCGKKFSRASDLNKHTNYHTKPFSCSVPGCNSSFGTKRDLDRHTKGRHETNRNDFFCPHAGCERAKRGLGREMGFTRKDHLQQHMRQKH